MCSDPLAFQWLSNDALGCQETKFVDVDFPDLMAKKREIILNAPQLRDLLGPYQIPEENSGIHLRSEHYSALGCDLTDISRLDALLANEINLSESLILCTAEVSVTYMDGEAADSLICWAAHHDHSMPEHVLNQSLVVLTVISTLLSPRAASTRWRRTPVCTKDDSAFQQSQYTPKIGA